MAKVSRVHVLTFVVLIPFIVLHSLEASEPFSAGAIRSLHQIEVTEGFQIELVAAEPLVQDPVDFDWGPDGRLWVVEMADYPLGADGTGAPGGRVRILEDTDGDGRYDHSILFADQLSTPNGILCWKKGVLVTACPDVLYLEDTTGDGKADKIEKLFSGFREGNQQHRVNGLRWGLDNWVYLANGDSGGTVVSNLTGQSVAINGRDLRIRPETGEIETQSGQTQYGRNRDDWGNWFGCNNPNPIFHYVLDEHYLRRNPHVAPPAVRRDIRNGDTIVYPIGPIISHCDTKYRKIGETPRFTSASATMVYRDNLFGPQYENVTFTSEPVYNIVHARKLIPKGVTFESVKLQEGEQEFFRSEDPWSRPTSLHVGPDGALYVADMVREVLEHPEWIADELEKTLDLYAGSDLGRIYRIIPIGAERRPFHRLDQQSTIELVASLNSPSGWERDLVQRMLIWRADSAAVAPLRALVIHGQTPIARLQALCTLDGMKTLSEADVAQCLRDTDPHLRQHAIRLSEQFANASQLHQVDWKTVLTPLVLDSDPHVRLQLAYTLGEFDTDWTARLLAQLAVNNRDDEYLTAAVFSSLNQRNVDAVLFALMEQADVPGVVVARIAAIGAKLGEPKGLARVIDSQQPGLLAWQMLSDLFRAMGNESHAIEQHLDESARAKLAAILLAAQTAAENEDEPVHERMIAIRVLGYLNKNRERDISLLTSLLTPQQPIEIQLAAINTLAETRDRRVPTILLKDWKTHSPLVRIKIIETLLSRTSWTQEFLAAIDATSVSPSSLSSTHRSQLLQHRDQEVRLHAEHLLGRIETNRQQVLERFAPVMKLIEDGQRSLDRGQVLFTKKCAACHRIGEIGNVVGPNLAAITNKSPEALLIAILDPNRAVEAKYLQYQVITNEGKVLSGLLTDETATSLTLVSAGGKLETLLRTEIDVIQSSNQSMMPLELEKDVSVEELADLLSFVRQQSESK